MKDYIDGAEAISLLFAIGYTFGVQRGRVRIVRRDEKTKSVVKSVVNETSQPTTIQPTKPTNQSKKQNFVGPGWGKESTKRRQVRNLFFSRA
jgi:preprotein translocase subunit SecF